MAERVRPHRSHVTASVAYRPILGLWTATCACGQQVNGPTRLHAVKRLGPHQGAHNRADARLAASRPLPYPPRRLDADGLLEILG